MLRLHGPLAGPGDRAGPAGRVARLRLGVRDPHRRPRVADRRHGLRHRHRAHPRGDRGGAHLHPHAGHHGADSGHDRRALGWTADARAGGVAPSRCRRAGTARRSTARWPRCGSTSEIVRAILRGEDPPAGQKWQTGFRLGGLDPRPDIPIFIAALSPAMLRLAGEIGDGVMLWLCNPSYIRDVVVPAVRSGRERAGETMTGFEIVAAVPAALTDAHRRRIRRDPRRAPDLLQPAVLPRDAGGLGLCGRHRSVRRRAG